MGGHSDTPLIVGGKRMDGRTVDELRPVEITAGVLNRANGSAYLTWGNNKVMVAVYGPREVFPKHAINPYKAIVRCRYLMAPFSTEDHGRSGPNRRSREISKVMREAFENVVITEVYPKTAIEIFVEILEGHGSTRVAGITAASVALANAGIPMRDMPVALSVGKIDGKMAVDMEKEEDNFGEADIAFAIKPTTKEIILLQMDGKVTRAEFEQSIEMALDKVDVLHEKQVEALKNYYDRVAASTVPQDGNSEEQ